MKIKLSKKEKDLLQNIIDIYDKRVMDFVKEGRTVRVNIIDNYPSSLSARMNSVVVGLVIPILDEIFGRNYL